jgi:hypothetical protein
MDEWWKRLRKLTRPCSQGVGRQRRHQSFGGALLLTVVVFFACYIPARAAIREDPIIALRYE